VKFKKRRKIIPQFIYDILVWINIVAFVIALIDKIAAGRLSGLFWISALCFGGAGSALSCYIFRHRTRNGDFGVVIFFTVVQFGILWLLESIF